MNESPRNENDRVKRKREERLHLRPVFFWFLAVAFLAFFVHFVSMRSSAFADFFSRYVSPYFRATLGYLSALFPFSLAEVVLLLSPFWIFLLFRLARHVARDAKKMSRMLSLLLCVPLLLYSLFVFSFATGYYKTPLADTLGYENTDPNEENLYAICLYLSEEAEKYAQEAGVLLTERGSSRMPMSYAEMNQKLIAAYDTVCEKYGFLSNFAVGTKSVLLSTPMAYTHITGVYSFMTGEMNVCTVFPDYSMIYTAAHEMAHARGIAREDEANFVAFLVLSSSDDPYINYAGHVMLLQYVSNALYDTSRTKHKDAWSQFSDTVVNEICGYNDVLLSFSETVVSDVAGSINNAYLESMGTGGSISYNLVVKLAVGYFSDK